MANLDSASEVNKIAQGCLQGTEMLPVEFENAAMILFFILIFNSKIRSTISVYNIFFLSHQTAGMRS